MSKIRSIFSHSPYVVGALCNFIGPRITGGDYREVCGHLVKAIQARPHATQTSAGLTFMGAAYWGLRQTFRASPATAALKAVEGEIYALLGKIDKLQDKNDKRIEALGKLRSAEQHDPSHLAYISSQHQNLCISLEKDIQSARQSIELKMNSAGETPAINRLRKMEISGLKKDVRLGEQRALPSDYLKSIVDHVVEELDQLHSEFQLSLNSFLDGAGEAREDHFPKREIYTNLRNTTYKALVDISKTRNTLEGEEPSLGQRMISKPTQSVLGIGTMALGAYLVASSFFGIPALPQDYRFQPSIAG